MKKRSQKGDKKTDLLSKMVIIVILRRIRSNTFVFSFLFVAHFDEPSCKSSIRICVPCTLLYKLIAFDRCQHRHEKEAIFQSLRRFALTKIHPRFTILRGSTILENVRRVYYFCQGPNPGGSSARPGRR